LERYLDTHGEGFFTLVWGVEDLGNAERVAAAAGYPRQGERIDCLRANPAWRLTYSYLMEAPLPPVASVNVMLIQAQPVRSSESP
jgi:hypothetical protein